MDEITYTGQVKTKAEIIDKLTAGTITREAILDLVETLWAKFEIVADSLEYIYDTLEIKRRMRRNKRRDDKKLDEAIAKKRTEELVERARMIVEGNLLYDMEADEIKLL